MFKRSGAGTQAAGVTVALSLMVWFRFDDLADPRDTINSEFSLLMVACVYAVIPALFKFVGMLLLWSWPLSEEKVKAEADIAAVRDGATES